MRCWRPSCRLNNRTTEVPDEACGGDETGLATRDTTGPLPYRAGHGSTAAEYPARYVSADVRAGDAPPTDGAACGGVAPAAGARYEAPRRNCRSFLAARFPRAASGLARDIRGSSTARSSRTAFASFRLAGHTDARRNRRRPPRKSLPSQLLEDPPKNWRDCARSSLGVSIQIDTISWGTLPAEENPVRRAWLRDHDLARRPLCSAGEVQRQKI
jgi:hypothetical protein